MTIQNIRVIDTRDNKEVWRGLCGHGEGEAIENAVAVSKISREFLRADVVEDTPHVDTPATVDESGGQDETHPVNKRPRSDKGRDHKKREGYYLYDGARNLSPAPMPWSEIEALYIDCAPDARKGLRVIQGREVTIAFKVTAE